MYDTAESFHHSIQWQWRPIKDQKIRLHDIAELKRNSSTKKQSDIIGYEVMACSTKVRCLCGTSV